MSPPPVSPSDADQSPSVYLREDPVLGSHLQNQSEIRAETAEKAAMFLDTAVAARAAGEDSSRSSHLLYTLHVFQYSVKSDKSSGGEAGQWYGKGVMGATGNGTWAL